MNKKIDDLAKKSENRYSFCIELINEFRLKNVVELGVFRGDFARKILLGCEYVEKYVMIDPWRNLSDWNKPANSDNETFESYYQETIQKTDFAKEKRRILRGKTTEVINELEDSFFDFVYIDGDHTLKGISIDLINLWPKVQSNGFIVGDDFSPTIWQHHEEFEPTLVFPFAVYFAEAVNCKIYAIPFNQFLISKAEKGFEFTDLTNGRYKNLELRNQFRNQSTNLREWLKKHSGLKKLGL